MTPVWFNYLSLFFTSTVNPVLNCCHWCMYNLPVWLTWAGIWRGWWWTEGEVLRRGREWWSPPLHLIGQLDRSASKAWLHRPLVCLGCRQDAEKTKTESKNRQICTRQQLELYCIRVDICSIGKLLPLKRWIKGRSHNCFTYFSAQCVPLTSYKSPKYTNISTKSYGIWSEITFYNAIIVGFDTDITANDSQFQIISVSLTKSIPLPKKTPI